MTAPRLSIVMPVYNVDAEHFSASIRTLLEQTFRDFELIVVDAGSARPRAGDHDLLNDWRVKHVRWDEPPSQTRQYNAGLARARGELVARADADDIYVPDRLERQVAFLDAHPQIDVVGSALLAIDGGGRLIGRRVYPLDHASIVAAMPYYNSVANPSLMFRRTILDRFGGWEDEPMSHARDYDWASRVARCGARFANIEEALVMYRIHDGAVKVAHLRASIRATLAVKRRHWLRDMRVGARIRYAAEHVLLVLPPRLVLAIFKAITFVPSR